MRESWNRRPHLWDRARVETMKLLTCQEYADEWSAWFDGYEHIIGRGPMEKEAIDDLREEIEAGNFDDDNLFDFACSLLRDEAQRLSRRAGAAVEGDNNRAGSSIASPNPTEEK